MTESSKKTRGRGEAKGRNEDRVASYYEQIVDSLASGVIAFDEHGVIMTVNRAAREHLGVGEQDLCLGMRLSDLLPGSPFADVLRSVLDTHAPLSRREILIPMPDGCKKEIGFSASLLHGPHRFNGAVFLFVDMTERRTLERAAELNLQLAKIGELTAGVVHELRNPLSVIAGMAELLQRRFDPQEKTHKFVTTILNETRQLERLIAQFLGFAKPFALEASPCHASGIVERTIALCEPRAETKGVSLSSRIDSGLPSMTADAPRLAQALVNIVSNAIDAVASGGHVELRARRDDADILFEITDDGPGIHLAPGEDLFKPFFSKKESGTGLGLAICHRIVTAHTGTIVYGNREEGGAYFEVRVPIEKGAPR